MFNHEKHEIVRVSNLNIDSALLIDMLHLYIVDDPPGYIEIQTADPDKDYELRKPERVLRPACSDGLTAISFSKLMQGRFNELLVQKSALNHNAHINYSTSTD